jgi:nuclear transport factor 2 (NTF2) superfamily protein
MRACDGRPECKNCCESKHPHGNENWEFDEDGLMLYRIASINDAPIKEADRKFFWLLGRRPDHHPSPSDLSL